MRSSSGIQVLVISKSSGWQAGAFLFLRPGRALCHISLPFALAESAQLQLGQQKSDS